MQHKTCSKCHDIKTLDQFPLKSGGGLHGVASQCKKCYSQINKDSYIKNKEKVLARQKANYQRKKQA